MHRLLLASLVLGVDAGLRTRSLARLQQLRLLDDDRVGAPPGEAWEACAEEGQMVPVSGRVRFGWAMSWVESSLASGMPCAITTFGTDPIPFIRKVCECFASDGQGARAREEMGLMWARCAGEGEMCDCPSGAVRFGEGERWAFTDPPARAAAAFLQSVEAAPPAPPMRCEPAGFGGRDPAEGTPKECWCEQARDDAPKAPSRVAVVMLSRRPPNLRTWLEYHLNYMGVERVFMQVEDTPEFNATWDTVEPFLQERVRLWRGDIPGAATDSRPADDYETLQRRQVHAMKRAKDESAQIGIQWLIHIDDDELLYTKPYRRVGDILAAMPAGFDQAYIPNAEAVYPSADVQNCFSETTEINVNAFTFASYANGKAAVRVANQAALPAGPHQWRDNMGVEIPSIHLDREPFGSPILVVHFESCPFPRWQDKFWELGNTSPAKIHKIPFRFYRESIQRMQECRAWQSSGQAGEASSQGGPEPAECSEESLKSFWSQWKTEANPSLRRRDLVPLQIPWGAISSPY